MKECKVQLKDGDKEAELNITYKEQNEIVIIDGIFKFFGIEVDYEELARKQLVIEKMYAAYYADDKNYRSAAGSAELAETGEPDFKVKKKEEIKRTNVEMGDNPGIRIKNGVKRYRCNYKCPKCYRSGNHYIPEHAKVVSCHECNNRMNVHKTHHDFSHDENFNYFLAGLKTKKED